MKITPLFLCSVLIAWGGRSVTAAEPREVTIAWATTVTVGSGGVGQIVPSLSNSVYVAGMFSGDLTLGNLSVSSSGDDDIFIAKLNDRGQPLWLKRTGAVGRDYGFIAADAQGNVFLTSNYHLDADNAPYERFLTKYDPEGSELWRRSLGNGSQGSSIPDTFPIGPDGSVYIVTSDYPAKTVSLRKYNPDGSVAWIRATPFTGEVATGQMGIDAENRLYVPIGFFFRGGSIQFGSQVFASSVYPHVSWLARFDSEGEFQWGHQILGGRMAVDSSGQSFFAGNLSQPARFGEIDLTPRAAQGDALVMSYDSTGQPLWVRQFGSSGEQSGGGVALHNKMIYVAGNFFTNTRFDDVDLQHDGGQGPNHFLMQLNYAGEMQWVTRFGGLDAAEIAMEQNGDIYLGGGRSIIKVIPDPELRFARSDNTLVLSWQLSAAGYVLEQAGSLQPGTVWAPVDALPVPVGEQKVVTVPMDSRAKFFRLRKS